MRNPASAGPTARARFMLTAPSAAAARTSWRGTMSGMSACQGGMLTAAPAPSRKVKVSSSAGGRSPARDSPASTTPVTKVSSCTAMRRRRRSNESASTPAGRARSSIGSRLAVWTSDTSVAALGSSTSSHCAPTVCIQVPIMLPSWASQSARNAAMRSGDQAEPAARSAEGGLFTPAACPVGDDRDPNFRGAERGEGSAGVTPPSTSRRPRGEAQQCHRRPVLAQHGRLRHGQRGASGSPRRTRCTSAVR